MFRKGYLYKKNNQVHFSANSPWHQKKDLSHEENDKAIRSILAALKTWRANLDWQDKSRNSLLHHAAKKKYPKTVKFLCNNSTSINKSNNLGQNPLSYMCFTGQPDRQKYQQWERYESCIASLVKAGSNLTVRDLSDYSVKECYEARKKEPREAWSRPAIKRPDGTIMFPAALTENAKFVDAIEKGLSKLGINS